MPNSQKQGILGVCPIVAKPRLTDLDKHSPFTLTTRSTNNFLNNCYELIIYLALHSFSSFDILDNKLNYHWKVTTLFRIFHWRV